MAHLPNVQQDISLLRRFIRAVADLPTDPNPQLDAAESNAETLLRRLETPVRIAVTGLSGAGKSSLVNLLLGEELARIGTTEPLPAIVFHHADSATTTAGWWDRPSKDFVGHDLDAALKENPDLISIGVDSPILKSLQLVDVSGLDQPGHDKDAVLALTQLADVLIWCSRADAPLSDDQLRLVKMLPNRLTKNSLLVLTHADGVPEDQLEEAAVEVENHPGAGFLYVAPIATPQAWQAFQGDADDPATLWAESGAPDTLACLMEVATNTRHKEVAKIQRNIAKQIIPFLNQVPMPPEEVAPTPEPVSAIASDVEKPAPEPVLAEPEPEDPVDEATPEVAPTEGQIEISGSAVLLDEWLARLAELHERVDSGEIDENQDFVQGAQEIVSDYLDDLADNDDLPEGLDWLIADYEKANDLMILLQFESSDHTASDAARILAQLTDSLCHV